MSLYKTSFFLLYRHIPAFGAHGNSRKSNNPVRMINTNFTLNAGLSAKEIPLHHLVQSLLMVLSEKEKFIIESRFSLDLNKHLTLEEIGGRFGLTRERIRQIEKGALRKLERSAQNTNIKTFAEFAKKLLEREGGVLRDKEFKQELLALLPNITEEKIQDLHLALVLDPSLHFKSNTLSHHPYWHLHRIDEKSIKKNSEKIAQILNKSKRLMSIKELRNELLKQNLDDFEEKAIANVVQISKECKSTDKGVGLFEWRHVHPRTLRDKIRFILNQEKRPMHFQKIAKTIEAGRFDQKKTNLQAIHNELIRNENFILIGRGIYALKEWGFETGTVSEVIEGILRDSAPMTREEITNAVLAQRQVKNITIYLNLKNTEKFERVGRNHYALKKG